MDKISGIDWQIVKEEMHEKGFAIIQKLISVALLKTLVASNCTHKLI